MRARSHTVLAPMLAPMLPVGCVSVPEGGASAEVPSALDCDGLAHEHTQALQHRGAESLPTTTGSRA